MTISQWELTLASSSVGIVLSETVSLDYLHKKRFLCDTTAGRDHESFKFVCVCQKWLSVSDSQQSTKVHRPVTSPSRSRALLTAHKFYSLTLIQFPFSDLFCRINFPISWLQPKIRPTWNEKSGFCCYCQSIPTPILEGFVPSLPSDRYWPFFCNTWSPTANFLLPSYGFWCSWHNADYFIPTLACNLSSTLFLLIEKTLTDHQTRMNSL
jgi:hypothetical protein